MECKFLLQYGTSQLFNTVFRLGTVPKFDNFLTKILKVVCSYNICYTVRFVADPDPELAN